ncbi:uncharacterized protein CC84DRAFT_1219798 [Paraphaeosphaeria sporulosa]|uniref:Uncharacterized protein n=1 Tax=Paraphaeosphaeria sporulosa TaxID=1460663 RepID=A0A177C5R3_9PLEO|nr:uncharacterized protein CC84DRAFT_1219798 [Paraphaeosphaeria sporulosa]OAG02855.1 hypothetical protein CC84DRAFT_1219798 [Paraphaeosphaeria sporulosa]
MPLQASRTLDTSRRSPERMGRCTSSPTETFNQLVQAVLGAATRPRPYVAAPSLHQLSPDISFIHRSEVVAHQAAIRTGRHSPALEHQARGSRAIDVVGYTYAPGRRDASATALYAEGSTPGAYLPPPPPEIPSPTRVRSPFHGESISLAPVQRPVLVSRLDQPPFVPALPARTVLRPAREWRRVGSAPESGWESVLGHSAVYRAKGEGYRPRVPSPLREQHGTESLAGGSSGSSGEWSHGTMPRDENEEQREMGRRGKVNGVGQGPRLRGGGEWEDYFSLPVRGVDWDEDWVSDGDERTLLDEGQQPRDYFHCQVFPEGHKLDICMHPTTEIPRLRGGGKPKRNRIPASLFYMAGATGRRPNESITVDAWNSMKPKKRMGGLLGMAMYGYKSGKSYVPETRDQEVQTDAEPEAAALVTVDVGISDESPAVDSARAVSPARTPGLETSQDGNEGSRSEDAPASGAEGIVDAGEPSSSAAEPDADRPSIPTAGNVADDTPAAAPPEPASKSHADDGAPAPEATPPPTPDDAAKDTPNSGPGAAPLPYPTTPLLADVSGGKKGVPKSGEPVQMPLTPEELVNKVVEEMKRKGLVG